MKNFLFIFCAFLIFGSCKVNSNVCNKRWRKSVMAGNFCWCKKPNCAETHPCGSLHLSVILDGNKSKVRCGQIDKYGNMWVPTQNGDNADILLKTHISSYSATILSLEKIQLLCEEALKFAFWGYQDIELLKFDEFDSARFSSNEDGYEVAIRIYNVKTGGGHLRIIPLGKDGIVMMDKIFSA